MENPKPGTPEYRKLVRKKLIFDTSTFFFGILGILGMIALVYFDIPQSEPAKLLTTFLIFCFAALSIVALWVGINLMLSAWAQTRLTQLRDNQSRKDS